jgi:hypothetical protein
MTKVDNTVTAHVPAGIQISNLTGVDRLKFIVQYNLERVTKAIKLKTHKDNVGYGYNIGEQDAYKRILKELNNII